MAGSGVLRDLAGQSRYTSLRRRRASSRDLFDAEWWVLMLPLLRLFLNAVLHVWGKSAEHEPLQDTECFVWLLPLALSQMVRWGSDSAS